VRIRRAVLAAISALLALGAAPAAAAPPANDFRLSVAPASRTVHQGRATHFTIGVPRGAGFRAAIDLSVRGLPRRTSGGFTPFGAGYDLHRTLLISIGKKAKVGTYALTVIAAGGHRTHQRHVTLKIIH
jgi:hypothetical protein